MGIWMPGGLNNGETPASIDIVTFGGGTDEQIGVMLNAYYNDELSWEDMAWTIGDERVIHLDSMAAANPNSSTTMPAQDITVVIVDHDHTDLETSINGHDKACITVQTKECLHNLSSNNGTAGHIYIDGSSFYDTSFTKWSNLYMRTYLNSVVWGAFSTDFKSMIKPSKHYRHTTYNGNTAEEVVDNIFLPSVRELFDANSITYYVDTNPAEGSQFAYYSNGDTTRRIKYGNDNGQPNWTAQPWWSGSASTNFVKVANRFNSYYWNDVGSDGTSGCTDGTSALALSPAWAM